ncbi:hypothetical protein SK3146_01358 [Paenibacillus konkukensis]|uniref:Uncharacterized protein n=1 Tax=Paenibacillus konkukensis TaxID=2020716 RepID=A0ABY4RIA6_9BACL|nr:hypothetical protein SK3146_01358 [Paenibacillus konkukensis]
MDAAADFFTALLMQQGKAFLIFKMNDTMDMFHFFR